MTNDMQFLLLMGWTFVCIGALAVFVTALVRRDVQTGDEGRRERSGSGSA